MISDKNIVFNFLMEQNTKNDNIDLSTSNDSELIEISDSEIIIQENENSYDISDVIESSENNYEINCGGTLITLSQYEYSNLEDYITKVNDVLFIDKNYDEIGNTLIDNGEILITGYEYCNEKIIKIISTDNKIFETLLSTISCSKKWFNNDCYEINSEYDSNITNKLLTILRNKYVDKYDGNIIKLLDSIKVEYKYNFLLEIWDKNEIDNDAISNLSKNYINMIRHPILLNTFNINNFIDGKSPLIKVNKNIFSTDKLDFGKKIKFEINGKNNRVYDILKNIIIIIDLPIENYVKDFEKKIINFVEIFNIHESDTRMNKIDKNMLQFFSDKIFSKTKMKLIFENDLIDIMRIKVNIGNMLKFFNLHLSIFSNININIDVNNLDKIIKNSKQIPLLNIFLNCEFIKFTIQNTNFNPNTKNFLTNSMYYPIELNVEKSSKLFDSTQLSLLELKQDNYLGLKSIIVYIPKKYSSSSSSLIRLSIYEKNNNILLPIIRENNNDNNMIYEHGNNIFDIYPLNNCVIEIDSINATKIMIFLEFIIII